MRCMRMVCVSFLLGAIAHGQCSKACFAMYDDAKYDNRISTGGPNLLIGIKVRVTAPVAAQRLEVLTGKRSGSGSLAIWSHDAAGNKPGTKLAGNPYLQSAAIGWQGANLDTAQLLLPNKDYWFVWGMPNGSQSSIRQRHASRQGQLYRGSFNGGTSWNGPFSFYEWKLRVFCCKKFPGVFATFGSACGPRGQAPRMGHVGVPVIGKSYQVTVSATIPRRPALLTLGVSKTQWGPFRLPLDLTQAGAQGCLLLCSIDVGAGKATDGSGNASNAVPIPNDSAFVGVVYHHQWVVFSPAANTLGAIFSNGGTVQIGR